jgi:hypothetical protein
MLVPAPDAGGLRTAEGTPMLRPLKLSLPDAIAVAKRGRRLLRAGRITHREYAILDCLLWSCRNPTTGGISASYSVLQRLAKVSRGTIAAALTTLERLRVLSRVKRRAVVAWHQGGLQARQLANAYILHPPHCEFAGRPVNENREVLISVPAVSGGALAAAQAALAQRRATVEARLLLNGSAGQVGAQ